MARSSRNKSSTSITQGEINGAVTKGSRGNDGLGFKDSNIICLEKIPHCFCSHLALPA